MQNEDLLSQMGRRNKEDLETEMVGSRSPKLLPLWGQIRDVYSLTSLQKVWHSKSLSRVLKLFSFRQSVESAQTISLVCQSFHTLTESEFADPVLKPCSNEIGKPRKGLKRSNWFILEVKRQQSRVCKVRDHLTTSSKERQSLKTELTKCKSDIWETLRASTHSQI